MSTWTETCPFAMARMWWDDMTLKERFWKRAVQPSEPDQLVRRSRRVAWLVEGEFLKEFDSPPFPFPPPGASRGHTALLRGAGESAGPKAKPLDGGLGPERKVALGRGSRPGPRAALCNAKRTDHV
jgi:hypothetical protein